MSKKRRMVPLIWVRRGVQATFLACFVWLVFAARFRESGAPGEAVQLFFDFDPLVLLGTWLAAHTVPAAALLALATVALTLVLGRVFCGWICPLGTVHAMASCLRRPGRKVLMQTEAFSRWQRGKYYLLVGLVVMALFGAHWIGVFDPLSLLYRSTATVLLPAAQYGVEEGANAVYHADPHLGPLHVTAVTEPVYRFFREHVFLTARQAFAGSWAIALLFVAIVALNLTRKRFWCRYLCPLGALLGLFAKRPMLRLENDAEQCGGCNLCTVDCQGAAQPAHPDAWMPTECFACYNCVGACPSGALAFRFRSPLRPATTAKLDLGRRALVTSGLAGLGGLLLFRLSPQAQARTFNPLLVRPPGSLPEPEFLRRCIQCGLCMKVCPTTALHPATTEAGLEGVWSPVLISRIGYCEHTCNLCGQVCPTGAIEPLALKEKQETKIGLATIDTTRCLPYAYGRECIVCEEHCPTPTKAIYFVEREVRLRDGRTRVLKQPQVDASLCIGCGICENKCPFTDLPAIRVTSANESRHPANQPVLPGPDLWQTAPATGDEAPADPYANPYGS